MEPIYIVRPGHYESIETVDSTGKADGHNIIRIIGQVREGIWKDSDGKHYSESELQNNWVALDTATTQSPNIQKKKNLFAGFTPTHVEDTVQQTYLDDHDSYRYSEREPVVKPVQKEVYHVETPKIEEREGHSKVAKQQEQFNELEFLLSRASIETLNKNSNDQYGTMPYSDFKLVLNVPVAIPYDIEKIKQIIELFNLDKNKVVNYLKQFVVIDEFTIVNTLNSIIIGNESVQKQTEKKVIDTERFEQKFDDKSSISPTMASEERKPQIQTEIKNGIQSTEQNFKPVSFFDSL